MRYFIKITISLFCFTLVLLIGLIHYLPKPQLLQGISFSKAIYDENHQLLRLSLSQDEKYRLYTPINHIAPVLIETTLLQEDRHFYQHPGINPFAFLRAIGATYIKQSRRMGASTISMQVARLRFGIPSKTAAGKLYQMFKALQLEYHYSKKQILEAYLNLAPFGGNIEGVGAASFIYFHTSAPNLKLPQALSLSLIPQNPNKRADLRSHDIVKLRSQLFQNWVKYHPEQKQLKALVDLPITYASTKNLPFFAPHLVHHLLHATSFKEHTLVTNINLNLEKRFERTIKQYLARHHHLGVSNAAVLLVDRRTMAVKVSIGSADFYNQKIQGQINGTTIKRSPGSTLKPFIYALAFDQGLIHPNTVLKDVPQRFGTYNPENFDKDFMGPIQAKDALMLSRNIPAITLANALKERNLFTLLEQAEVGNLKPESYYGLSLSLGGAELTLEELVSLYAMLANNGLWKPLRYMKTSPIAAGKRLLSPEASFLTRDILEQTAKPPGFESFSLPVSWKTGTSSGYRDAWTLGIVGPYVLGVWLGNFNNQGNPAFIGKNLAAPLFFELITNLKQEEPSLKAQNPHLELLNLKKIEVCKASGMLPTSACPTRTLSWFIPGKSPIKTDTIYQEIALDAETGLRTCHINEHTRFAVFEFWPSDLLAIFKRAGITRRTPPPYVKDCALKGKSSFSPEITSPQNQVHYIMRLNNPTLIPFTAITSGDVKTLYWFINESYLGKISANHPFFWKPKPGNYTVRVVDDHGLSATRSIKIQSAI